jgi:hypothetical protein
MNVAHIIVFGGILAAIAWAHRGQLGQIGIFSKKDAECRAAIRADRRPAGPAGGASGPADD